MLYDYLATNYDNDEPIFINELPGNSKDYIRQEMKRLTDLGKIRRVQNGVYYLSYSTIFGTEGKVSINKYIKKKYLISNGKKIGFLVGLGFANKNGFTTQNSSYVEVCSNNATTKQRKTCIDGRKIIVYKPVVEINDSNANVLQFLEFMSIINKYSELSGREYKVKLNALIKNLNIEFKEVKKYLQYFPSQTYKNLYDGGLMNELV